MSKELISALNSMFRAYEKDPLGKDKELIDCFIIAGILFRSGDNQEALERCQKAIEIGVEKGLVAEQLNFYSKAIACFEKVFELLVNKKRIIKSFS